MNFGEDIVAAISHFAPFISKFAPTVGASLGGPVGLAVGGLVSSVIGKQAKTMDEIGEKLNDPDTQQRLKELDAYLAAHENARAQSALETGALRFVRPFLAMVAMFAIALSVAAYHYLKEPDLDYILSLFLVILVLIIKQIYEFYFGESSTSFSNLIQRFMRK